MMERLTTKFEGYFVPKEFIEVDEYDITAECKDCYEICEKANNNCKECAIQRCFEKLAAYEDAEEKGLLLRLPCKVGDKIYRFWYVSDTPYRIQEQTIKTLSQVVAIMEDGSFGKTVFLTMEEAEAKLAEQKG